MIAIENLIRINQTPIKKTIRRVLINCYNYIYPHMGINGMTPAQMANIPINWTQNRWETMIGFAVIK
jgi:hypothetical protein